MRIIAEPTRSAHPDQYAKRLIDSSAEECFKLTAEYGIAVFDGAEIDPENKQILHIWYEVKGHKFETLHEVRKALESKAFL
jgi:hypothetical protein